MSEKTTISWTKHSWNPWRGCKKISPGCAHCYMFTEQRRYGNDPAVVMRTKTWGDPLKWQKKAAAAGVFENVFTCSWSDWFIEQADEWREEAWQIVKRTPNLIYQILTKRPENIASRLPKDWGSGYQNVWLGVSVEDQKHADKRITKLLKIPAVVRFLSCEPLLGPVDLRSIQIEDAMIDSLTPTCCPFNRGKSQDDQCAGPGCNGVSISWVIAGGESGHGFREMKLEWARSLRDQCRAAGVPFFFKQSSAIRSETGTELDGETIHEYPV